MNLLGGLQADSAARLAADAFFSDADAPTPHLIPAYYEQLFDIQNKIKIAVAQIGIVTVVQEVSGSKGNGNRLRPYFDAIRIVARTFENVTINRSPAGTWQPASVVAEAAAWILHGWRPDGLGASLVCTDVVLVPHPNRLVYDAIFTAQAGMKDTAIARISPPTT